MAYTKDMWFREQKEQLQAELIRDLDYTREVREEELLELIDSKIQQLSRGGQLTLRQRKELRKEIFSSMRRLDVLQELIENPGVTEIMINGKDAVFVEQNGTLERWENTFPTEEKLQDIIQQMVAGCNRVVNEASPIVDARLADGSRVNVVLPPVALDGPMVTIRRFPEKPMDMKKLLELKALTEEAATFLKDMVKAGANIFVSGGTGSGKTTFLNALSGEIPKDERIITIEDSAELQLIDTDNLVRLETRSGNGEGATEVTIRDLIRCALRMRPDRIIVGEVRGEEAIDLLQAMNTGHDGSLSTGHSNSASDMLSRLETMVLMGMEIPVVAVRQQIASALDIIVHLGRLRDKSRKVLEIVEVCECKQGEITLNHLYRYDYEKNVLCKVGEPKNTKKLEAAGFIQK